ncbi:DUF5804 family protein [Natronosalvus amylolyticus]|uniref:DUF5804 family protein n=1 Tax=Natronosalvus amylolyticus TaxID=2961994 RepID=UPI0020C9474C|nr:DUF5804 family protein [Natronosalvus amylolyticus]
MTRVCFVGSPDVNLQYELLSRETSREALATYDLRRPFENSLEVRTISLGAAISLCNDLQWYLVRFVDTVLIQEPSVSDDEWLSRSLARALRDGHLEPADTGTYLQVYGLERPDPTSDKVDATGADTADASSDDQPTDDTDTPTANKSGGGRQAQTVQQESQQAESTETATDSQTAPRLVEPLYVKRVDGDVPEYDLRPVDETLVVRLTEDEFSP